jgi:outer membrane receptor protein involved in Fe transport
MFLHKFVKTVCVIALLLTVQISFAQNKVITGKVTDSKDGTGVPGVNVSGKGTRIVVQTKADGTYSISVPSSVNTLVISSVGYGSQEVSISGKTAADVSLVVTNTSLNEVVVIGYGTQRRREVTGAISKVTGDKLNTIVAPSFEAALQGKAPGVQVLQGNGLAGSGAVIRIRGNGSISAGGDPLYVVDGIPIISDQFLRTNGGAMNQNPLASLNPADIESIEIL